MSSVKSPKVYEIVPGFFRQDDGSGGSCAVLPQFGLKEITPNRWENLFKEVEGLNKTTPQGVSYKIVFVGRHGEGYHNLAESKYGTKLWDEYWARLNGDGLIEWGPDALLTPLGETQASEARNVWQEERIAGLPAPDAIYCSPLTRALRTCEITFSGVVSFKERQPVILEDCREMYGNHTCDKRRTLSYIHSNFPDFLTEEGFSEDDPRFDPKYIEDEEHLVGRAKDALDYIFDHEDGIFISITAHSGFLRGIQKATNHALVDLKTGGVLPMIVKSTWH